MDHLEIVQNLESDASDAGLDFSSSEKLFFYVSVLFIPSVCCLDVTKITFCRLVEGASWFLRGTSH